MLAGVVNMNFKYFLTTNLITRPISLFCLCFVSTGIVIPYHSWGLIVWSIIFLIIIFLFIFTVKYKQKIENFFNLKLNPNKKD
jgi:membrane protein DedA with SNARE-associated domain